MGRSANAPNNRSPSAANKEKGARARLPSQDEFNAAAAAAQKEKEEARIKRISTPVLEVANAATEKESNSPLRQIMANPRTAPILFRNLEESGQADKVAFLDSVQSYTMLFDDSDGKQDPADEEQRRILQSAAAQNIYQEFFSSTSVSLPISDSAYNTLTSRVQHGDLSRDLFDQADREVFRYVEKNLMPLFEKTDDFKTAMAMLTEREGLTLTLLLLLLLLLLLFMLWRCCCHHTHSSAANPDIKVEDEKERRKREHGALLRAADVGAFGIGGDEEEDEESSAFEALTQALQRGDFKFVRSIVEDAAFNLDYQDREGNTALHFVAPLKEKVSLAKYIITMGAKADIPNNVSAFVVIFFVSAATNFSVLGGRYASDCGCSSAGVECDAVSYFLWRFRVFQKPPTSKRIQIRANCS